MAGAGEEWTARWASLAYPVHAAHAGKHLRPTKPSKYATLGRVQFVPMKRGRGRAHVLRKDGRVAGMEPVSRWLVRVRNGPRGGQAWRTPCTLRELAAGSTAVPACSQSWPPALLVVSTGGRGQYRAIGLFCEQGAMQVFGHGEVGEPEVLQACAQSTKRQAEPLLG